VELIEWRKARRSGDQGGACVEVARFPQAVAVPVVADVPYAYPLMGVGLMAFIATSRGLLEQRRRI